MIPTSITLDEQADWGLSDSHKLLLDELLQKVNDLEARVAALESANP
jgi:hypothetical protein